MSQFIEVQSVGDKRFVLRAGAVERIELPPGANLETEISPEAPIVLHMKGGAEVASYNKTGQQLLVALIADNACVLLDTPDEHLSVRGERAGG